MNIQQAKYEIIRTFRAYTARRDDGEYRISPDKQRPILLIGPPGIGKKTGSYPCPSIRSRSGS